MRLEIDADDRARALDHDHGHARQRLLWPGGPTRADPAYELLGRAQARSRGARLRRFLELARPTRETRVLDVGITNDLFRASNFLEAGYPFPERITAVSADPAVDLFRRAFPEVDVVIADGRELPFGDREFDVAFSNAVLEHVGSDDDQARFVAELCRVADRVWLSTPNPAFPLETHTLVPVAHWLPRGWRDAVWRRTGREWWTDPEHLNLVRAARLRAMVPPGYRVSEPQPAPLRVRVMQPVTTLWIERVVDPLAPPGGTRPRGPRPTPPT